MNTATGFKLRATALALLLAGGGVLPVWASGYDGGDDFVSFSRTEVRLDRYVQGELGTVLPSYSRPMLYTAWRAIASADAKRPLVPIAGEWLDKACCTAIYSPSNYESEKHPPIGAWLSARKEVVADAPQWRPGSMRAADEKSYEEFLNCPDGAYAFAVETLAALRRRPDATPVRLKAWIDGQDRVFAQCTAEPPGRTAATAKQTPEPRPSIEALPASEPLHWRQARDYQRAASAFYASDWIPAETGFARIAADEGNPWQAWAALARMRTVLRQATLTPRDEGDYGPQKLPPTLLGKLQPMAAFIGTHADWTVQQRAADDLLNLVRARSEPEKRLSQLTRELAVLDKAPPAQALADWARISDHWLDEGTPKDLAARETVVRALPVFDWIFALRGCMAGYTGAVKSPESTGAAPLSRWKAQPDSVLWLIPTMVCADGKTLAKDASTWKAIQAAADKVPATHPGWRTVRMQQVRLLREAGEFDRARTQLAALTSPTGPTSTARNLAAEEALRLARTPAEAIPWLARESGAWSRYSQTDAVYPYDYPGSTTRALDDDGASLLVTRFTVSEWPAVIGSKAVPDKIRAALAFGLWWRADVLDQPELARAAATTLAGLLPKTEGEALTGAYFKATTPAERRAALWRASITRNGLSAQVDRGLGPNMMLVGQKPGDPKEAVAGTWCRLDQGANSEQKDWERLHPIPGPATGWPAADVVAKERAALAAIGTATGAYARWVLAESKRPDRPADLPWLLYVGIQSTKGGCVDKDKSAQSKAMFQTLHRLYPKSEWAKRSPYFY
ncbi:hypothetical protein [Roseateles sp. L2-2]|uniref:hypothetical protein n=1 Tax=Roseateles sp. L2-2 TaxID=3422597 RepID=UPI003D36F4F6